MKWPNRRQHQTRAGEREGGQKTRIYHIRSFSFLRSETDLSGSSDNNEKKKQFEQKIPCHLAHIAEKKLGVEVLHAVVINASGVLLRCC